MNQISKDDVKQIIETAHNVSPNTMEYTLIDPQNGKNEIAKIQLKTNLTIDEKSAFVSRVVNGMFGEDGNYMPWFLDPLFMITLVQMTTNVPVFKRKHTDGDGKKIDVVDVEKTYELAKALNLGNVPNESYHMLVAELQGMIRESIEYYKQRVLSQERQMLSKAREELENGVAMVSAMGEELKGSLSQFSELLTKVDDPLVREKLNAI